MILTMTPLSNSLASFSAAVVAPPLLIPENIPSSIDKDTVAIHTGEVKITTQKTKS